MKRFAPGPPIPIANDERLSIANSKKFCTPLGVSLRRRATIVSGMITTAITTQLMMIEPVIDG